MGWRSLSCPFLIRTALGPLRTASAPRFAPCYVNNWTSRRVKGAALSSGGVSLNSTQLNLAGWR